MNTNNRPARSFAVALVLAALTLAGAGTAQAANDDAPLYVEVSDVARAPIGWVEFCASNPGECATIPSAPLDVVLTAQAFRDLLSVNRYVNESARSWGYSRLDCRPFGNLTFSKVIAMSCLST